MADKEDDAQRLKITQKLNAALEEQRKILESSAKALSSQLEITQKLAEAMEKMSAFLI